MQISTHNLSATATPIPGTSNISPQHYVDDLELSARIRQRNMEAIEKFYEKYAGAFYGVINKTLMAEQVSVSTMETAFTKIVSSIHEYDPSKERLFIWAFRIARKEASKQKVNLVLKQIFCC